MAGETILVGGTNLSATAHITNWDDILSGPPTRADIIALDFTPGAQAQVGQPAAYDMIVPLVMAADDHDQAVADALALQALAGTVTTITRTIRTPTGLVSTTCQGLITNAVRTTWNLDFRSIVRVTLIITNLDGGWS